MIYVTSSMPYGPEGVFIIPEVKEIIEQGHEVLIVPMYPRGAVLHGDTEPLLEHTITQPLLSLSVAKAAIKEFVQAPAKALSILSWLFGSRSNEITLKNIVVYPKGLWLARLAREWRADHIHAHWAATTATMALIASEISGTPWSCTAHRWDIVENNLLASKVARVSFMRFISHSGLEMVKTLGIENLETKALVLHMGVPLNVPPICTDNRTQSATPVVLCSASLKAVKGHKYLIEAVAVLLKERNFDLELWLAGEGELREELQKRVKRLGLSNRVKFLGHLSHSELMKLYRQKKVAVVALPSIDLGGGEHEGIPVSLMEAMGYSIPVVSTTTGGIPELLGGGAGLLVPPEDPYALADGIQQLIEDPEQRGRLAQAGRERVEKEFAVDKMAARLAARFEACKEGRMGVEE